MSDALNILAIDPANLTGYAHSNGESGVWDITADQGRAPHPGNRLIMFAEKLEIAIKIWGCDLLAAEDASFGSINPHTAAQHNELKGVILRVLAEHAPKAEIKFFQPTTIKLFATGNGWAKKADMVRAVKTHFGFEPSDDNQADALWVLELAKRRDCWAKKAVKDKRPKSKRAAKKAGYLF